MEILGKLFCSPARVKLLRLFIFNGETPFTSADIARRSRVTSASVRREIAALKGIGLIKKKSFYQEVERKVGGKKKLVKKKVDGWVLDPTFEYLGPLQEFLMQTTPLNDKDVLRRLRGTGRLKLVITSGVFIHQWDSRVDLLVVGDQIKRGAIESAIRSLEAELGRELRFAVLSSHDFQYRLSVYDRLVRDVLDFPHSTLLDRFGIYESKTPA